MLNYNEKLLDKWSYVWIGLIRDSPNENLCAIACEIIGIPFYISIRPEKPGGLGKIDAPCQYHPTDLELKSHNYAVTKGVIFAW